jgi:hypothetical protein
MSTSTTTIPPAERPRAQNMPRQTLRHQPGAMRQRQALHQTAPKTRRPGHHLCRFNPRCALPLTWISLPWLRLLAEPEDIVGHGEGPRPPSEIPRRAGDIIGAPCFGASILVELDVCLRRDLEGKPWRHLARIGEQYSRTNPGRRRRCCRHRARGASRRRRTARATSGA